VAAIAMTTAAIEALKERFTKNHTVYQPFMFHAYRIKPDQYGIFIVLNMYCLSPNTVAPAGIPRLTTTPACPWVPRWQGRLEQP
jgi:hypothetical protein